MEICESVSVWVYECLSVAYQQKTQSLSSTVIKYIAAKSTAVDCHGARICAYASGMCPSLSKEGHFGPHVSPHQSPCVGHTALLNSPLLGVGVTIFAQLFQPHCYSDRSQRGLGLGGGGWWRKGTWDHGTALFGHDRQVSKSIYGCYPGPFPTSTQTLLSFVPIAYWPRNLTYMC